MRWVVAAALALALLSPLAVAQAANPDVLPVLGAAFNALLTGIVQLTRLAYCAAGIGALC